MAPAAPPGSAARWDSLNSSPSSVVSQSSRRVALTPPAFLNLRECALQSQPQLLQYHSVMPSHSSRSARTARPDLMERCSDGVMGACRTGTTSAAPHSGQRGDLLTAGFFLLAFFLFTGFRIGGNGSDRLAELARYVHEQLCLGVCQLPADRHQAAVGREPEIFRIDVF